MALRVYGHKSCDTCRKAWKYLDDNGVEIERVSIVDTPPTRQELEQAWRRSGLDLKRFFNTSGRSYRSGGWSDRIKAGASQAEQLDGLAGDPMLIKRPLAIGDAHVIVGFKPELYQPLLG
ncbi:MAG: Spx/MgsR family RNA polymerase-binding regulatory protein [Myxococcota bacterium]